jgi:hypothetical protein
MISLTLRDAVGAELRRRREVAELRRAQRRGSRCAPAVTANAGHYHEVGRQLVASVDAAMLGDVSCPDAAVSWQPVIRPAPRHLCPRPVASVRPLSVRPAAGSAHPRRIRRTRRPSRARAPDDGGPHDPIKRNGPGHLTRAAATDQPEGTLRDRMQHPAR